MPSFDIISEFDVHEAKNAVDQANKEVTTRFDFKGTDSSFELNLSITTNVQCSLFQTHETRHRHRLYGSQRCKRQRKIDAPRSFA